MEVFLIATGSDITIGQALSNMVVGLGTVFVALLFLCGVISLFKRIGKLDSSSQKKAPAKAPVKAAAPAKAPAAAPAKPTLGGEDPAVAAAILAAVSATCGNGVKVTSIAKSK